ncbi:MAG: hypothetical protein KDB22_16965 [Planctomycetales bacterium]|nr:hypothetical protein [Planctomycetales bacterium]
MSTVQKQRQGWPVTLGDLVLDSDTILYSTGIPLVLSSTILLTIVAAGMLVISGTRFAVDGISSGRSHRWARISRSKHARQRQQAAEVARLNSELHSASGGSLQWRVMEVAEVVDESRDCKSF